MATRISARIADDHLYHSARARDELEAAYRAERPQVAAIRLKLCALHIRRARSALRRSANAPAWELDWIEHSLSCHEKCLAPT
ncbi:MAG: hypothetical protein ACXW2T_07465 [Allosphingosinicella sp.]